MSAHGKRALRLVGRMLVTGLVFAIPSCGDPNLQNELTDEPVPVAPANDSVIDDSITEFPSKSGKPTERSFEGIRFTIPGEWKETPLSDMQRGILDAKYEIPSEAGLVRVTLSSVGGGIEANIQRWENQFQLSADEKPKRETISVAGVDAFWVDLRGSFSTGVEGNLTGKTDSPSEQRMLGVAIPMSPRDYYIKLTGSREAVAEVQEAFRSFISTARFKR